MCINRKFKGGYGRINMMEFLISVLVAFGSMALIYIFEGEREGIPNGIIILLCIGFLIIAIFANL